jgi:hypothetical protein
MKKRQAEKNVSAYSMKMGDTGSINQGQNDPTQDEQQKDGQAQDIQDGLKPQWKGHLSQESLAGRLDPAPVQNKVNEYGHRHTASQPLMQVYIDESRGDGGQ